MSYQQPQDYYTHSNASQFDDRYQQGAYRDENSNYQQYSSGGNGGGSYPQQQQSYGGGYQDASPMNTPYGSRFDLDHQPQQQSHQDASAYKDYAGSDAYYADGAAANAASAAAQKYSYEAPKKSTSKWLKYGLPLLILILIGGGVGGYFGYKATQDSDSSTSTAKAGDTNSWTGTTNSVPSNIDSSTSSAASNAAKAGGGNDITYSGTDMYANPMFISAASNLGAPTMGGNQVGNCGSDPYSGTGSLDADSLRPHPRLMAPQHIWDCLPEKIANDAYLTVWNASIFKNATAWAAEAPVAYVTDGGLVGSGILDPARDVQQRVKAWSYAYQVSKDTKWVDRLWTELQTAAGNTSQEWGQGNVEGKDAPHWNSAHFLDLAELTAAYAIAYDWLYNIWTDDQKTAIMWSIISLGLVPGNAAHDDTGSGWFFQPENGNGNWNCVTNSGLMLGSLAVLGDDPTTNSADLLKKSIDNMSANCMRGVYKDGSWAETPNYWYFGTNAHARGVSSLITATGTDQGMMDQNPDFTKTGLYHMYVSGMGGMFAYADNGPNKYATTANQMFLYSTLEKNPLYGLFQRDRADAADPFSMIWYDTSTQGAFWDGLALDNYFNTPNSSWVSMRSSWTDFTGTYVAMKASILTGHQSHGDLDVGDFVIDAMGTRWAGEFGNANYLSSNYFSNETQGSDRWGYYRKATQGQNTLVIGETNQLVTALPVNSFGTTNAQQSAALDYKPSVNDVAYFTTDMSSAYGQDAGTVKRGIRMLNGRRQVLVQDEISSTVTDNIMWLVHTNATITLSSDKKTATMKIQKLEDINAGFAVDGSLAKEQTMVVKILSPPGATFEVVEPLSSGKPDRIYGTDPNVAIDQEGDQEQPGISRLQITLNGGSDQLIQVLWQPQWSDLTAADSADPKNVALSSWSTTSHNV